MPNDEKKILSVTASSPFSIPPPSIMITKCYKLLTGESRVSLPTAGVPVPPSHLHYSSNLSSIVHLDDHLISAKHIEESKRLRSSKTRSRHKRKKSTTLQRPQPTFWRHNPAVRGKSLGYALGYPGNWTAYDDHSAWSAKQYKRDTMRKGIYIDAL